MPAPNYEIDIKLKGAQDVVNSFKSINKEGDLTTATITRMDAAGKKLTQTTRTYNAATKETVTQTVKFNKTNLDLIATYTKVAGAVGVVTAALAGLGAAYARVKLEADEAVGEAAAAERIYRQQATVLASTGQAAGQSARELQEFASAMQQTTIYGDEAVAVAQNMLLTFTNIRDDAFDPATQAVLDMATAYQAQGVPAMEALQGAAVRIGKALQDPINGVTALRRVGVQLSDQQAALVKQLVATGKGMEAQQIILDELSREFGGSATQALMTYEGALLQARNAGDELQESLGRIFSESGAVRGILQKFSRDVFGVADAFKDMGKWGDAAVLALTDMAVAAARVGKTVGSIWGGAVGWKAGDELLKDALDWQQAARQGVRDKMVDDILGVPGTGFIPDDAQFNQPGGGRKARAKKEQYTYPHDFSGWGEQSHIVQSTVLSIRNALISAGIQSARRIMGLPDDQMDAGWMTSRMPGGLLGMAAVSGITGGALNAIAGTRAREIGMAQASMFSQQMSARGGMVRIGGLTLEESMRRAYGGPQVEMGGTRRYEMDQDTGQWVRITDDFNQRSIYHKQNRFAYAQAALNGDMQGLGGLIGAGYGAGWGIAGMLGGGLLKKGLGGLGRLFGIGGGGGKDDRGLDPSRPIYTQDVQLSEKFTQFLNVAIPLLAGATGQSVNAITGQLRAQTASAGGVKT